MASSGVLTGNYSGSSKVHLRVEWKVKSQNQEANKSVIQVDLYCTGKDGARHWNLNNHVSYVTVNGNKKQNTATRFDTNKNPSKLLTKEFTVSHDTDGDGSFKIAARHYSGVKLGNGVISGTKQTLPKINRISKIGTTTFSRDNDGYPKAVKSTYTRYNSSYTQVYHIQIGSWKKTVNNYKSGENILFTSSEIEAIKKVIGKTFTVTVYISTYKGSTHIGDSAKWTHTYTLPTENTKVYIKVDSSTIRQVKGIYIKPTSSLIAKAKSVYVKPTSSLIGKC